MSAPEVPWVALVLVALCFPFLTNILQAIGGSFAMLFSEARRRELVCRINFKQSVDVAYILFIPTYALVLFLSGVSPHSFWRILGVLVGWAVLREVILFFLRRRSGDPTTADTGRFFRSIFVLCTLFSLPVTLLPWLAPSWVPGMSSVVVAAVAGTSLLTYIYKSYKAFLSPKFSHISSFLYLCGLDLLPIVVVVTLLVQ